jgi:signal transduction histidine kinase
MALTRLEYWLTTPISVLWRDIQDGQISNKLVRVFFLQIMAISMAAGVGVWIAIQAVEGMVLEKTLAAEAEYFWERYADDSTADLPDTNSLKVFLVDAGDEAELPQSLRGQTPGFRRVDMGASERSSIYVSERAGKKLVLLFRGEKLLQASFLLGVAPLLGAMLVIYFLTWLGYISSKRALSPLVKLAERVENFDFSSQKLTAINMADIAAEADIETLSLLRAFEHFTERLQSMIERERLFTRNASHELRTPLAVVKGNMELLRHRADKPEMRQQAIERMQRAVIDMQGLIEALLLLARDEQQQMPESNIDVAELLRKIMDTELSILGKQHLQHSIDVNYPLLLRAPERVLSIIFSNLLRNAFTYTDSGSVTITINKRSVSISDTGIGMDKTELNHAFEPFFRGQHHEKEGHGLGLALVARLCRSYGWNISADSKLGEGTTLTLVFPAKITITEKQLEASQQSQKVG